MDLELQEFINRKVTEYAEELRNGELEEQQIGLCAAELREQIIELTKEIVKDAIIHEQQKVRIERREAGTNVNGERIVEYWSGKQLMLVATVAASPVVQFGKGWE